MTFDIERFRKAKLTHRQVEVKLPELKDWFGEGVEPIFHVRGLSGEEFYNVREAEQKRAAFKEIADRMLSGDGAAFADAIEEFFGAVPAEYVRRVEVLIQGTVDPKLDRPNATKFITHYPVSAHTVCEEILRQTGLGSVAGE